MRVGGKIGAGGGEGVGKGIAKENEKDCFKNFLKQKKFKADTKTKINEIRLAHLRRVNV